MSLGPLKWAGDTTLQYRRDILLPFFKQYLVPGAPRADTPPVLIYNTGENHWDRFTRWPLSCDSGCPDQSRPLYLGSGGTLSFDAPASGGSQPRPMANSMTSTSPTRPNPCLSRQRPFHFNDEDAWRTWLVHDQRFVDGRTDVLTFETAPLTEPLRLSGRPIVHLYASTSGTDSDWVVKLIDVYPGADPYDVPMGGYELPISLDIFRGRYRTSFEHPEAITPDKPLLYQFGLPMVNHVFYPATASWCRCSPLCFRSTTAIRRPLCPTSSTPGRRIIKRRPSASGIRRQTPARSACRSCLPAVCLPNLCLPNRRALVNRASARFTPPSG